jgi:tRNA(fMet)-specific endonuclease VapC
MKYLLDTNVCVVAIRRPRGKLAMRVRQTPHTEMAISAVTAAELLAGALRKKSTAHQTDACKKLVQLFRWLPFDVADAQTFGRTGALLMDQGHTIGGMDLQIAATALNRNLIVVTHNVKEFSRVPSLLIEDWQAEVGEDL